jgi:hypothetical protein
MIANESDAKRRCADRPNRRREGDMKRICACVAVAAGVALAGWASTAPAKAAPPTVTPSPGYDARLQQQRAAPVIYEPRAVAPKRLSRRHKKRIYDGAH